MNQVRILQAVGIAIVCLLLGSIVVGIIMSYQGVSPLQISSKEILAYFLPIQVIAQFVMGSWLGRKIRRASYTSVFAYLFC